MLYYEFTKCPALDASELCLMSCLPYSQQFYVFPFPAIHSRIIIPEVQDSCVCYSVNIGVVHSIEINVGK